MANLSCILVTHASSSYWLTLGQGLLSLKQVWIEGRWGMFIFVQFLHFHFYSFCFPVPLLFSSPVLSLLSLFCLSLGDDKIIHKGVRVVKPEHNQNSLSLVNLSV